MPKRIQMHRRKGGWRKDNPDAVIVARPTKWGNPWAVADGTVFDRQEAVDEFKMWAEDCLDPRVTGSLFDGLHELRGKDLACWCPLDQPCHADVLLAIANRPIRSVDQ
mgnify:CR=1 FL=1